MISPSESASAQQVFRLETPSSEPDEATLNRARELFQRGTKDADEGRWSDALHLFTESYRLSGRAAALYNAATTLRSLGRYRDARDAFDQMLAEHDTLKDEMRNNARNLRDEVAARVSLLILNDAPADPNLVIRFDGDQIEDEGKRPVLLEADPGKHNLRVELPNYLPFLWEGALSDGSKEVVTVQMQMIEEESSIFAHPVFWIVTGVVILAGAGVGTYFAFKDQDLLDSSGQSDFVFSVGN